MLRAWHLPLRLPDALRQQGPALLDDGERARAARFRFEADRDRFIAAHVGMRMLLGKALGVAPATLQFATGAAGKPRLAGPEAASGIHFNLAHSGAHALLAIDTGREIGVDLEVPASDRPAPMEVATLFSAAERAALDALPAAERPLALYRCWVRKEALLKASGDGIPAGLDRFSVSIGPQAVLLAADDPRWSPDAWWLQALERAGEWVGAVAARGAAAPALSVQEWDWG